MTTPNTIPCISIRQPWAWLIVHGGKDIENRTWSTRVRGRILIHAAKGMTLAEWNDCYWWVRTHVRVSLAMAIPMVDHLPRGGIVGGVDLVDCVDRSTSPWFVGRYGFVLANAKALPFVPLTGQRGFFPVHPELHPLLNVITTVDAYIERIRAGGGDPYRKAIQEDPVRQCRVCGCTDADCSGCIDRTGEPCHWVAADLCSACVDKTGEVRA